MIGVGLIRLHIPDFLNRAGACLLAPIDMVDLGGRIIGRHDLARELVRAYPYLDQHVAGAIGNQYVVPDAPRPIENSIRRGTI